MKILIVYGKDDTLKEYVDSLRKGAESRGHQVTVKVAEDDRGEQLSCHPYDLLIVGSPILGLFGGKVAGSLRPFLSGIKRTEGKESIAFSRHKLLGTDKGLRQLMSLMESQGCIVKDFQAFRSASEAYQFGTRL